MQNELELISRLKAKDEKALALLYDKYAAALYGVIFRMCRNQVAAEDILQDTFLTIWNKSELYDSTKGRFYTWSYRIARNKVLNFLRKPNTLIQTEDLSVYASREANQLTKNDTLELKGAINHLEEHHKRAIELVYFSGLTHKEAHEEMDVPLGTFKSYVRQALIKLKENYSKTMVVLFILTELM